ncbi:MAG: Lrp/AsnC family transcriptional regulator [Nanoarchaeota archaeon]|nr:Lrp/AsnC family transcriptional regulator [Nanoarchaeota archaeon]
MVLKLDTKDLRILAELDKNARQSNRKIGKKVGLSKEVVKYRIDKLIENKIIVRFHTITNYFKLGIMKFKLYLRLTNINKKKIEEIANYFKNNKTTEWDVFCTGRWDIIIGFLVHNVNEFDDEIQNVMNKYSKYIQEKAVTTTLHLVHQERGFLGKGKNPPIFHTLKDKKEDIDNIDLEILKILANNARMPIIDIAEIIKTTPRIVQYKIKQLEKKGIILAYKAHLNPKQIDRIFCKAILYLTNLTQEKEKKFISYASSIPDVVWPQKVLGDWDFELDCEVESYDHFQNILLDLKEKFPEIIKDYEFCIVSEEYKLDFFPGAYREKLINKEL